MDSSIKVLILGCGYTGTRLAHLLLEHGVAVNVTTRKGLPLPEVDAPCYRFPELTTAAGSPLLPEALAGVTHVLSTIPPDDQGADPVVTHLMPLLEAARLEWFGYLSTTGVYGDVQGTWVDETTPVNPQNARSQNRISAETAFLNSALPTHIFRLPGIYGLGRSTFDRLRTGKARRIDRPGHVFCRIHVDDIAQTLWASIQHPQPGSIYNVSDDEPTEPSNLIVEAAYLLGIAPPEPIPSDQVEMSPMSASFWRESRRVSNRKIKTELGITLQYPTYREGLRAILQSETDLVRP